MRWQGAEQLVAHREALSNGSAGRFVMDCLCNPIHMLEHQCKTLVSTVPALRVAFESLQGALRRGDKLELGRGERTAAANSLASAKLRWVRKQIAAMLRWLARLRGLFVEFGAMVRTHVKLDDMRLIAPRFMGLVSVTNLLTGLTEAACSSDGRHCSSLLETLTFNLKFHCELDRHAFPEVAKKHLDRHTSMPNFLTAKALYVVKQAQHIFDYLRWFGIGPERKRLSIKFEMLHRLIGFDVQHPDLQEQIQTLAHGGHASCFSAYAFEMCDALQRLSLADLTWEHLADAILEVEVLARLLPDRGGGARSQRRSPEVQKAARDFLRLFRSVAECFATDLHKVVAARLRHFGALDALLSKLITVLKESPESVDGLQEAPDARAAGLSLDRMEQMGRSLGAWTEEDLFTWDHHCLALGELAVDVNLRFRNAMGGHYMELVWMSDVYEYDQADSNDGAPPPEYMLCREKTERVRAAAVLLWRLAESGSVRSSASSPATAPASALVEPARDAAAPASKKKAGGKKGKKR